MTTASTVAEAIAQMMQDRIQAKIPTHLENYGETEQQIKISIDLW